MNRRFWSLVHDRWREIKSILSEYHEPSDPARLVIGDDSSAITEFTISEDWELSRRHQSPRLRQYLLAAAEADHDIIHELLKKNGETVRPGNHPLPS